MTNSIQEQLQAIQDQLLNIKKVLTIKEVLRYTGYSKSHLYKLTANNQIPYSKPNGKSLFFDKDEIDQWLLRNKQEVIDISWTQSNTN
jgi:excisionase family DNA binding protein